MTKETVTAEKLTHVRDFLIDALGDHMVASTVFAKRLPTICRRLERGANPQSVARSIWNTDFAGDNGYESI